MLDNVGLRYPHRASGAAQHKPGSKIDISLDDDQPPKLQPDPAPGQILQTEMEIVNRHHEEVREQHRRARVQQEG